MLRPLWTKSFHRDEKDGGNKLKIIDLDAEREIFIGLVAPMGADLDLVSQIISDQLASLRYEIVNIRVTDIFREISIEDFTVDETDLYNKIYTSILFGNKLREITNCKEILGVAAASMIAKARKDANTNTRRAFIVRQFKRKEEIDFMRMIYGRSFILFSVYQELTIRESALKRKLNKDGNRREEEATYAKQAAELVSRDEAEEEDENGQRVRDTFPMGDFIIDLSSRDKISDSVGRFFRLLFSNPYVTPNKDEQGMYFASAAALRSSDLSRQVGAAIVSPNGHLLSTGCNEVPKAGGGTYWEADLADTRDFKLGYDPNVAHKEEILREILGKMQKNRLFNQTLNNKPLEDLYEMIFGKSDAPLSRARVLDLLEYGRVVHAEMVAISEAARFGVLLQDSTLYCTTFPCHNCARHIVASGIKRVVYVEPYSKSLAEDLYTDSISIEGRNNPQCDKVIFEQFSGISPERYRDLFRYRDSHYKANRKDRRGRVVKWEKNSAKPKTYTLSPNYLWHEKECIDAITSLAGNSKKARQKAAPRRKATKTGQKSRVTPNRPSSRK